MVAPIPEDARAWLDELLRDREHPGWSAFSRLVRGACQRAGVVDEDQVEDVFVRVLGKLPGWRGRYAGELFMWVLAIARNMKLDEAKRAQAQKRAGALVVYDDARSWGHHRAWIVADALVLERELEDAGGVELGATVRLLVKGADVEDVALATGLSWSGAQKRVRRARQAVAAVLMPAVS